MINRKDSLCYIEFIRGKYNLNNPNYIQILIDKFNLSEKQNLLNSDFDKLWNKLWLIDSRDTKYKDEYDKSKKKFDSLKKGFIKDKTFIDLEFLILNSTTTYPETEWEFPKGRKNNNEKNINCAVRECSEETNFTKSDYDLLINVSPLGETYTGENNIRYRHIYYISFLKNYDKLIELGKNYTQSLEVADIQWFDEGEALNKLRDYHKSRVKVITDIFKFVNNLEEYIIL